MKSKSVKEKEFNIDEVERKQTAYVKCANCGANMVFDPVTQSLKCPHCGTLEDFKKSSNVVELDILDSFSVHENWDKESSVYRCENCGAVVVLHPTDVATFCPYCNTSHIVKSEELAGLKPNAVYPFTITLESAVERAKVWAKKRWFAPKNFKKSLKAKNAKGIYEPCFTFDSFTYSTYEGRIGKRHTRVVGSGKNRRTETYIKWKYIQGTYAINYDDVMINASSSYEQVTLNKLLPFDFNTIKTYEQKFLTGFIARRHEKDIHTAWEDAKVEIDSRIKKGILSEYSYDVVDYLNVSTNHEKVTYKYVLIPVYQLSYRFKKKTYAVYVNGNTGSVAGKTPISPLKVSILILLGLLFIGAIVILMQQ